MTHTMIPRTNYFMEQESFPMQAKPVVMEAGTVDRTKLAEEERWALQGHAQVAPSLGTPCLGPCGPRDMIS